MVFKIDLRLSEFEIKKSKDNDKEYCFLSVLDEKDNKYFFFLDYKFAQILKTKKKYDNLHLTLELYKSKDKNGNYQYKVGALDCQ